MLCLQGVPDVPLEPPEEAGLTKGLARVFSNTTVQSINSLVLSFLHSPTLTSIHDGWMASRTR